MYQYFSYKNFKHNDKDLDVHEKEREWLGTC